MTVFNLDNDCKSQRCKCFEKKGFVLLANQRQTSSLNNLDSQNYPVVGSVSLHLIF